MKPMPGSMPGRVLVAPRLAGHTGFPGIQQGTDRQGLAATALVNI